MPLHPTVHSDLLGKKLADHDLDVWLVNTGWTGGPYGIGERFKIAHSRAVIRADISGALDDVEFRVDPVFGFAVPEECPGIPSEILNPRATWEDKAAYDEKGQYLAGLFVENFKEFATRHRPQLVRPDQWQASSVTWRRVATPFVAWRYRAATRGRRGCNEHDRRGSAWPCRSRQHEKVR